MFVIFSRIKVHFFFHLAMTILIYKKITIFAPLFTIQN